MPKMRFQPGLRPGPHWGSLQRSPRLPSWFSGVLLLRGGVKGKGRKREERGRGREGKEKEMGREGRGKGESLAPQPPKAGDATDVLSVFLSHRTCLSAFFITLKCH